MTQHGFRRTRVREHQRSNAPHVREHERQLAPDPRERHAAPSRQTAVQVAGDEHARLALRDLDDNINHNEWDPTTSPDGVAWSDLEGDELVAEARRAAEHIIEEGEVDESTRQAAVEQMTTFLLARIAYWQGHTGVPMVCAPRAPQVHAYPDDSPQPLYVSPEELQLLNGKLLRVKRLSPDEMDEITEKALHARHEAARLFDGDEREMDASTSGAILRELARERPNMSGDWYSPKVRALSDRVRGEYNDYAAEESLAEASRG